MRQRHKSQLFTVIRFSSSRNRYTFRTFSLWQFKRIKNRTVCSVRQCDTTNSSEEIEFELLLFVCWMLRPKLRWHGSLESNSQNVFPSFAVGPKRLTKLLQLICKFRELRIEHRAFRAILDFGHNVPCGHSTPAIHLKECFFRFKRSATFYKVDFSRNDLKENKLFRVTSVTAVNGKRRVEQAEFRRNSVKLTRRFVISHWIGISKTIK